MDQSKLYDEDELVPISALQHLIFCERQWALIHLEKIWSENRLTAEGRQIHDQVNIPSSSSRRSLRITRSLRLRSLKLGLTGVADVVEFHRQNGGHWIPYPVEYKRGVPKKDLSDVVQLCAQALCLEEMLSVSILKGAMYYGENNRRVEIEFDLSLRTNTIKFIKKLHQLSEIRQTPTAVFEKKCDSCSLVNWCVPKCTNGSKKTSDYIGRVLDFIHEEENLI